MSAWITPAPRDWPGRARWLADAAAGKQVSPALCESSQAAALLAEMARVLRWRLAQCGNPGSSRDRRGIGGTISGRQ